MHEWIWTNKIVEINGDTNPQETYPYQMHPEKSLLDVDFGLAEWSVRPSSKNEIDIAITPRQVVQTDDKQLSNMNNMDTYQMWYQGYYVP